MGKAVFVDGRLAGSITSAAYGHTIHKSLAIGFIKSTVISKETKIEVSLFGERIKAKYIETIPYDPQNLRLKA